MNGYFISITNNLLEEKHYEAMGNAVWLYMWLIDKMTDISEGQGIVNGGHPVSYAMINKNFETLPWRTYMDWVKRLRDAGYINTVQAKYGLYITINKAKKSFGRSVQTSYAEKDIPEPKSNSSYAKKRTPAMQNPASSYAKSRIALNRNTINKDNTSNKTSMASKSPAHEKISKIYYEAIKSLGLPVKNHNTLKNKIKAMATDTEPAKSIIYLEWIRDKYAKTDWNFKPHLNEALDIYSKRVQIENSLKAAAKEQAENKVFRV